MKSEVTRNIGKLLLNDEFSDFKIICQGKVFNVHRNILTCSSDVFQPMLTNDTQEKQTGQLVIEDMEADTVEDMVNYIYTGTVKDTVLDGKAMDLFVVADRLLTMSWKII